MNLVVTGATSFLGAPMAEYCLEQGHRVFAVVRPASKNMAQAEELQVRFPSRMVLIPMNLEDLEKIPELVKEPCQVWIHFGWDGAGSGNRTQQVIQQKNVGDSLCALKGAAALRLPPLFIQRFSGRIWHTGQSDERDGFLPSSF